MGPDARNARGPKTKKGTKKGVGEPSKASIQSVPDSVALAATLSAVSAMAEEEGLVDLRVAAGQVCAVKRFLYTTAVMVGLQPYRYERRYCYEHEADAREALAAWTSGEHPPGPWIKCKGQGIDLLNPAVFHGG